MNDEFLHGIRVEPPKEFLARLKSQLDLQPPPTPPGKSSTLARLIMGLLLSGAVFAITLFILNNGKADYSVNTEPQREQQPAATTPKPTASAKPAPTRRAPMSPGPAV